jgi:TonB family protein
VLSTLRIERAFVLFARTCTVICLIFAMRSSAFAACHAPHYRTGHVWEDSHSAVMINISIEMSDFAPSKLVCLAQTLKERYGPQRQIEVLIFSTRAAAEHYTMPLSGDSVLPRTAWAMQLYATYFFHPDKHEEYLYVTPNPAKSHIGSAFDDRIDLPVTSTPACKFQISGRCLLAFGDIEYPQDARKAQASGSITVTATIARNGEVENASVAEPRPVSMENELARVALDNLKTWRFETAPRRDDIRITYSYVIDPSPGDGRTSVKMDLPNHVVVTGTTSSSQ